MWAACPPTWMAAFGPQMNVLPAPLATVKLVAVGAGLACTVVLVVSVRPMTRPMTRTTSAVKAERA